MNSPVPDCLLLRPAPGEVDKKHLVDATQIATSAVQRLRRTRRLRHRPVFYDNLPVFNRSLHFQRKLALQKRFLRYFSQDNDVPSIHFGDADRMLPGQEPLWRRVSNSLARECNSLAREREVHSREGLFAAQGSYLPAAPDIKCEPLRLRLAAGGSGLAEPCLP